MCMAAAVVLAACGSQSPPPSLGSATGSAAASFSPLASGSASPAQSASPAGHDGMPATSGWHGRVLADEVRLRTAPGLAADGVVVYVPDAPPYPVLVGKTTRNQQVYVLDGPVEADGLSWYLVAPTDGDHFVAPQFSGWMAAGDGVDAWLVEDELPCPGGDVELADITYTAASWAVRIDCFAGRRLTLRGWFPSLPADWMSPEGCGLEPVFLRCGPGAIMPVEMDLLDPRNVNRLDFALDPASGLSMPGGDQWIMLTGRFDHPAAAACTLEVESPIKDAYDLNVLSCRLIFVADEVVTLGR